MPNHSKKDQDQFTLRSTEVKDKRKPSFSTNNLHLEPFIMQTTSSSEITDNSLLSVLVYNLQPMLVTEKTLWLIGYLTMYATLCSDVEMFARDKLWWLQ